MVPKRLDKDGKLRRALAEGQGSVWVHSQGMAIPTTTLPIDSKRIVALFGFIAKGLAWYHWQAYLGSDHFVDVLTLSSAGEKVFDERFFNLNSRHRVRANLGNGTFVYEGVQGVDCPQVTAWRISVYGGLCLAGDPADPSAVSSCIDIVTGPARVKRDADLAGRFGWQQPEVALVRLAAKRVLHLP
jgi:hypothetical protein